LRIPDTLEQDLIDRWPVGRLATVGANGVPHQVPIVFARAADALWSSIDGKPKQGGVPVRIRNIRVQPRVSLLLDHYDFDWNRLWWLRIDGTAEVCELESAHETTSAALAALRAKYPQYDHTPVVGDELLLIRILPNRVSSWCADPALTRALL
jgi:PPOX class probable F420-dependent enzyme